MIQRGTQIFVGIGGWEHEVLDRCLYSPAVTSSAEKLRLLCAAIQYRGSAADILG